MHRLTRRGFLGSLAAVAASVGRPATSTGISGPARVSAAKPLVGMQLYTLQGLLARDLVGTLAALREIGYDMVEVVALLGHSAEDFGRSLQQAGLRAPSVHVVSAAAQQPFLDMATGRMSSRDAWTKIDTSMDLRKMPAIIREAIAASTALGNDYLVLAAVDSALFESQAGMDRVISAYAMAGELCQASGLKFAFHPHLAEFQVTGGMTAVDRILQHTRSDRVYIELDFFWAAMAAVDIPALLRRYSGRFRLGHVKDFSREAVLPAGGFKNLDDIAPGMYEDVGHGQLDFAKWIPLARAAGMELFFVERDISPDPLASARRSYAALRQLLA